MLKKCLVLLLVLSVIPFAAAANNKENSNMTELYEITENFINKDIPTVGNLDTKMRELITIVVLTVNQQPEFLEPHIQKALKSGADAIEIREAIYQCAPYAGIPKALIAEKAANKVFEANGIKLPLKSTGTVSPETRYEEGLNTQVEIFGEKIKEMPSLYPKSQQHIPQFLAKYCFGDFYTRKGVDLKTRELLTLCMLVALGDTEGQIKGHIQGNLNMGNDKEILVAAINQCLPYIGFPRTLNALKYLNQIVPE